MFQLFKSKPPPFTPPTQESKNCSALSMVFGLAIRKARIAAGMTQEELGEKISVSQQSINKWESGNTLPQLHKLRDIIEALNADLYELLYGPCLDFKKDLISEIESNSEGDIKEIALIYAEDVLKDPLIKSINKKDPRYEIFLELISNAIIEEAKKENNNA